MMFGPKKNDPFLKNILDITENLNEAANYFVDFRLKTKEDVKTMADKLKEYEHKGDKLVHDLIHGLNQTFITVIEREDLLNLGVILDDILDGIEACASRFDMFDITEADEYMRQFSINIRDSVAEILKAIELLQTKQLMEMREFTVRVNELESVGDELLRSGIKQLFASSQDAIHIMKYKEMYEILERVSDSCEDVADALETIIMRNA